MNVAGDWIKVRVNLHESPEVLGIAEITGLDVFSVVGRLVAIWAWADQHTTDGRVRIVSAFCPHLVRDCPTFLSAMQKVGWLKASRGGYEIPHFDRHNGASAKRRALDAQRKRAVRESPQDVRKMSASDADEMTTREEKRRYIKPTHAPTPVDNSTPAAIATGQEIAQTPKAKPNGHRKTPPPFPIGWRRDQEKAKKAGAVYGVLPRPGEEFHEFIARIDAAMAAGKRQSGEVH